MSAEKQRDDAIVRHFTVAVFVVAKERVVLMRHSKLGLWLPPGGHIESGELPDDAAKREVKEETGLSVRLIGYRGSGIGVKPQTAPMGIQIETIAPGHEHIDLVYLAEPIPEADDTLVAEPGTVGLGWYSVEQARAIGATQEVLGWIDRALRIMQQISEDAR